MKEEIRTTYMELEELGWTQVLSDQESNMDSENSEEAPGFIQAIAEAERRQVRARETSAERRQRRSRRGQPVAQVDLLSDDEDLMAVEQGDNI
eukprot:12961797-Heterocapsa_arctica.AAC.1